jgi:hypothetical protein
MSTYYGSTAASSAANPPIRIVGGLGSGVNTASTAGSGAGLWFYNTTLGTSELLTAGAISDGFALGMKSGDVIFGVSCTGSSAAVFMGVLSVVASSGASIASSGGSLSSTR